MKKLNHSPYAKIVGTPAILKILLRISLFGFLVIAVIFFLAQGGGETAISLLIAALICMFLLFIHRKGYYSFAGVSLFILVSFIVTYNICIGHAIYDEAMLAYPLLIVISGLVFGKRYSVLVTIFVVAQLVLVYLLAEAGRVRPFGGAVKVGLEDSITTLIILITTGFLVWVVVDIIENAVENIIQSENDLENAYILTLEAWAKALEMRGREDPGHSERVTALSVSLAHRLGLDSTTVREVRQGALMHDIGKMGIPEKILLKTSPVDQSEKTILRKHTTMARDIIKNIQYLQGAIEIICCHHERYDGQGYPNQLEAEEIPLKAQLFSVVDCWDVLRSGRPCREAWTKEKALAYIEDQSGKKFSPEIVSAFIDLVTSGQGGGEVDG